MLHDLHPLAYYLSDDGPIARCVGVGGGGGGGGSSRDRLSYSTNFDRVDDWFVPRSSDVNGNAVLGQYDGNSRPAKVFNYEEGGEGVYLQFDFHELNTWDNERFYVHINNTTVDLGKFYFNDAVDGQDEVYRSGEQDGVYWYKSTSQSVAGVTSEGQTQLNQTHTIRMFIPEAFIDDDPESQEQVGVGFSSSTDQSVEDESWAIDNFTIRDVEGDDRDQFFFSNDDYGSALGPIQNFGISYGTALEALPSLWNTLTDRLDDRIGHLQDLAGLFAGRSLDTLGDDLLRGLAEEAKASFLTWSAGNGFTDWSTKLWDATDRYTRSDDSDSLVSKVLSTASVISTGTTAATFVSGPNFLAAVNLVNAGLFAVTSVVDDLNERDLPVASPQIPDDDIQLPSTTVFAKIIAELMDRGEDDLSISLASAVNDGYVSFAEFAANATLVSDVFEFTEDSQELSASPPDFSAIEKLGFTTTSELVDVYLSPFGAAETHMVTVQSGSETLHTDEVRLFYVEQYFFGYEDQTTYYFDRFEVI